MSQDAMLTRLRRLIDDAGHGFSQSAPDFLQDLSASGLTDARIAVELDANPRVQVQLGDVSYLATGGAIAIAIQTAVRALDPDPEGTTAYEGFFCRFNPKEGLLLRSGTIGSTSEVHVFPPDAGDDVTDALKLGAHVGGYEDTPTLDYTDEELQELLDLALAEQNRIGDITQWTYPTLPTEYATVVTYRAWGSIIDTKLGAAAHFYPQKVAGEEVSPNRIFDNLFRLRKWLDDKIDDITEDLESQIQVANLTRWDHFSGTYVGDNAYKPSETRPIMQTALEGEANTEAVVELAENLTMDTKKVYIAYRDQPGVFDPTLVNDDDFDGEEALSSGSVLSKTLTQLKNPLVKITGLTPGETYYFAAQLVDQNGNYYFSNEVELTLST